MQRSHNYAASRGRYPHVIAPEQTHGSSPVIRLPTAAAAVFISLFGFNKSRARLGGVGSGRRVLSSMSGPLCLPGRDDVIGFSLTARCSIVTVAGLSVRAIDVRDL